MRRKLATVGMAVSLAVLGHAPAYAYDREPQPSRSAPSAAVRFLQCVAHHESRGNPKEASDGVL